MKADESGRVETPLIPSPTPLARWLLVMLPFADTLVPAAENAAGARKEGRHGGCLWQQEGAAEGTLLVWSSETAAAALTCFIPLHLNFQVSASLLIIQ